MAGLRLARLRLGLRLRLWLRLRLGLLLDDLRLLG
jgi:hypothetical protein